MHPTLARFLDADLARETLRADKSGRTLDAGQRCFVEAARRWPDRREQLGLEPGRELAPTAQEAVLFLAAHAAVLALEEEPDLQADIERSRQALRTQGATDEQIQAFFGSMVLEEAFGEGESPDSFDDTFFRQSLEEVQHLARLTPESVRALHTRFGGEEGETPSTRRVAAEALILAAWSEGPQTVNGEHVEEALERAVSTLGEGRIQVAAEALDAFLEFLHAEGLVGPARLTRLRAALTRAATGFMGPPQGHA